MSKLDPRMRALLGVPDGVDLDPAIEHLTKGLADSGKLIEAGFAAMVGQCFPDAKLGTQRYAEMYMMFMAGAQHLFGSIMTMMDPGSEPTDQDQKRMMLIAKELAAFADVLALSTATPRGTG